MYRLVRSFLGAEHLISLVPDLLPIPRSDRYTTVHDTAVKATFEPKLKDVIPEPWVRCFLSIVWHDGSIAPHQDVAIEGQRFHVVLQSNPDAWLLHDGVWTQPLTGCIYTMDPTIEHATVNWGHSPRVLLVVDTKRDSTPT